jgi:hypothetical protein
VNLQNAARCNNKDSRCKVSLYFSYRIIHRRDMISGVIYSQYRLNDDIRRLQLIMPYAALFLRPHSMRHRECGLCTETTSSASARTTQKNSLYLGYTRGC